MSDSLPLKIFVYGTLMRGFMNHHVISDCIYLGDAATVNRYGLFVGAFPFVNSGVEASNIIGELYEVQTADQLKTLDDLEGHPNYYCRTECQIELRDSNEITDAQIYFNNNDSMEDAERVQSGSFKDADGAKEHRMDQS